MTVTTQPRESYAERMERLAREIRVHHSRNNGWVNPNRSQYIVY